MTDIDDHIPDATKMVTREEREELRRLRVEGRESLHKPEWNTGPFSKWLEAMDVASPRLLDTIDALETENARLRKPRCIGCGRTEDELHASDCSHINGTLALTYEQGIRDVLLIRCVKHHDVPQYNRNEIHGGECAACAVESLRATTTALEGGE